MRPELRERFRQLVERVEQAHEAHLARLRALPPPFGRGRLPRAPVRHLQGAAAGEVSWSKNPSSEVPASRREACSDRCRTALNRQRAADARATERAELGAALDQAERWHQRTGEMLQALRRRLTRQ